MARGAFGIFFCIVSTAVVVDGAIRSFTAERNVVSRGGQIKLTCVFDVPKVGETQHINKHLNKTIPDHLDPEEATEGLFGPRYSVVPTEDSGVVQEILTITDAMTGDSGNYSCSLFSSSRTTYLFQQIDVQVEPRSVKLFLNDMEILNGSSSQPLKPLQAYRLRCEVTGGNPNATVAISYGAAKVYPDNVTTSGAIYRYDQRDPTYPIMVPVERNTTAFANRWVFDGELGSDLVCAAKVDPSEAGIRTSFTPVIAEGPPLFECNDTVYANDGQRNFILSCVVFAKPSLSAASFFFTDGKNYTINGFPKNTIQSTPDMKYSGLVKDFSTIKNVMNLTVQTVNIRANIIYKFEAQNQNGSVIHSITIKATGSVPSVSVASLLNPQTFVALIISLVAFVVPRRS